MDLIVVLDRKRGRKRKTSTLAEGVIWRIAAKRALNQSAEATNLKFEDIKLRAREILASQSITEQMRDEAAEIWLLGGMSTPRVCLGGHNGHLPFQLMASELFNLVVAYRGKIKLSEYSRGRGGNTEQAYAPLVRLAVEIDRIAFNMLKTDSFVCKRLSAKRMKAATLSEGFARLFKVRT
jgi:hypothetical protein